MNEQITTAVVDLVFEYHFKYLAPVLLTFIVCLFGEKLVGFLSKSLNPSKWRVKT